MSGLRRLQYRGNDSAGIATIVKGHVEQRRAEGKIGKLEELLELEPLLGCNGIGHTRWATHGKPTEKNAHPHATDRLALVHNGIIENYRDLKAELEEKNGVEFQSQTDSEVPAQLITLYLNQGMEPLEAVRATLPRLEGAFALVIIFEGHDDLMIGARRGSPLAIGHGEGEMFFGSDAIALASLTSKVTFMEDGDHAVLTHVGVTIYDESGIEVKRPIKSISEEALADKAGERHFMKKEIKQQPDVTRNTLVKYLDLATSTAVLPPDFAFDFNNIDRVAFTGCGTAFFALRVAKYWFWRYARLLVDDEVASEFHNADIPLKAGGLTFVVSQSGETADTVAALRYAKSQGQKVAAILNVLESTIGRETDFTLPILCGPEIGVASTKAFTSQLAVLACIAIAAGRARGVLSAEDEVKLVQALSQVPRLMAETLKLEQQIERVAREISKVRSVLYLGRGPSYPLALEGALKLKEITYIHAEGYAAGELKHGPIALIDEKMPVVVIAPHDRDFPKTVSNMQEVAARGGRVILITDEKGKVAAGNDTMATLVLPEMDSFVAPLVYAIPVQLLAYHTAVIMGTDVDQPRNLAKSVTVQ